jgi:hypothetical protein
LEHNPLFSNSRTLCEKGKIPKGEKTMKDQITLNVEELEERIAPAIVLTNPGGNTPNSESAANGQAVDYLNPAGKAPSGWNKQD